MGLYLHMSMQDEERLERFLLWAIPTALQSESSQKQLSNESQNSIIKDSEEEPYKDSLVSKFLRWLTASVITGKLYQKSDMCPKFAETQNLKSLHSLLEHVKIISGQRNEIKTGGEELLASTIFYLHLLLGINYEVLPSVVSALCLLLFNASAFAGILLYLSIYIYIEKYFIYIFQLFIK